MASEVYLTADQKNTLRVFELRQVIICDAVVSPKDVADLAKKIIQDHGWTFKSSRYDIKRNRYFFSFTTEPTSNLRVIAPHDPTGRIHPDII